MTPSKQRSLHKFLSSCVLLTFVVQVIFPPQVCAQVMAPVSVVMPSVPIITPLHQVPVVLPSVFEKEKFVNVPDISFSFSRTDYVALLRPSQKRDVRSSSAIVRLTEPGRRRKSEQLAALRAIFFTANPTLPQSPRPTRPRPEIQQHPSAWDGIIDGSLREWGLASYLLVEAPHTSFHTGIRGKTGVGAKTATAYVAERFGLKAQGAHRRKTQAVFEFTAGTRPGDPGSFITRYAYNTDMLMTTVTYPKGNGVKYVYDSSNPNARARGNLLSVRQKANMAVADNNTNDLVTSITYEPQFNFPKTVTDPKGNVTQMIYDYELVVTDPRYAVKGNLVRVVQPAVGGISPQINITYNAFGQPLAITDANGNASGYTYHAATGYPASVARDPGGINAVTQFTYDTFGNVDTVTDPNGRVSNLDYNELGWLVRVTNPLGFVTKNTFDANGNVIKAERQADALATTWQTTEFTYDILNKLKTVKDPLNRVTTYNYDNNENLVSVLDAEGNTSGYLYDERDRLYTTTDANLSVTRHDYDQNGNLSKIIDANNNLTTYTYDLFDRLVTKTYADASLETYTYDKNNNRTQVKRPDLAVINFVYDALDRLTAETYPASAGLNTAYTYDVGSRLLTANTAASNVGYLYDALNRVTSTTQTLSAVPYTLTYNYDAVSNQTRVTYPSGKVVDYTYDVHDRMDLIKVGGTTLTDYDYDPLDRRTSKTFSTGPQQQAAYSFDMANQLLSLTNTVLPSTAISTYGYTYDNVGNRLSMSAPNGTHNYSYNNIYELTGVSGAQSHSFVYDNVGNRTTADGTSYVNNALHQYTQVGSTPISHSVNGNLTDDGTNDYSYDIENRLASFTNGTTSASYAYDAFNRRVSKTAAGVTKYFVYDGDDIIAEYNSAGTLLAEYVHGNSTDEVLTMTRSGQTYYYHHDGLGSVTEITDSSGAIVEKYRYTPYGATTILNSSDQPLATSPISNPFRFTGREHDEESGLYHYRARAYSPTLGRFLQRDPIGYFDSMNLYSYANNNPINWTDPFGLCPEEEGDSDDPDDSEDAPDNPSDGGWKRVWDDFWGTPEEWQKQFGDAAGAWLEEGFWKDPFWGLGGGSAAGSGSIGRAFAKAMPGSKAAKAGGEALQKIGGKIWERAKKLFPRNNRGSVGGQSGKIRGGHKKPKQSKGKFKGKRKETHQNPRSGRLNEKKRQKSNWRPWNT